MLHCILFFPLAINYMNNSSYSIKNRASNKANSYADKRITVWVRFKKKVLRKVSRHSYAQKNISHSKRYCIYRLCSDYAKAQRTETADNCGNQRVYT